MIMENCHFRSLETLISAFQDAHIVVWL